MAELTKTRILVADDDRDILDLVGFILTHAGYEVVSVADGSEAIAAIEADPPEMAILDVMMPGLSGIDVLRRVRANDSIKNMQVILLTVLASDSDVAAGFAAGATDYMTKPVILSELLQSVQKFLARTTYSARQPFQQPGMITTFATGPMRRPRPMVVS